MERSSDLLNYFDSCGADDFKGQTAIVRKKATRETILMRLRRQKSSSQRLILLRPSLRYLPLLQLPS